MWAKWVLGIYAILMMVGGFFGYMKSGSKVSMIAGGVAACLVGVGLWLSMTKPTLGYGVIGGVTCLLTVSFTMRLIKTQSFMPSGMLLILTLVALVISLMAIGQK